MRPFSLWFKVKNKEQWTVKTLNEARWQKSPRGAYQWKMTMRAGRGRVPSNDLDPKPKPRTVLVWYIEENSYLYIRGGAPRLVNMGCRQFCYRASG